MRFVEFTHGGKYDQLGEAMVSILAAVIGGGITGVIAVFNLSKQLRASRRDSLLVTLLSNADYAAVLKRFHDLLNSRSTDFEELRETVDHVAFRYLFLRKPKLEKKIRSELNYPNPSHLKLQKFYRKLLAP